MNFNNVVLGVVFVFYAFWPLAPLLRCHCVGYIIYNLHIDRDDHVVSLIKRARNVLEEKTKHGWIDRNFYFARLVSK